jgi:hypothetical protein
MNQKTYNRLYNEAPILMGKFIGSDVSRKTFTAILQMMNGTRSNILTKGLAWDKVKRKINGKTIWVWEVSEFE